MWCWKPLANCSKGGGETLKRLLKDKRGEGFVDVCVLVLAIAMVLALVVRIAPVFVAKQNLDVFADELVRTAEINGQVGSATSAKAADLREQTGLDPNISWSDTGKIQLGNEVEVTLTPLKDSEGVLFIAAYTPDYYRALYMKGEMPVSLKSGESQTFKVTCYSARSSEGIPTGQYKLDIYFNPTVAEDWMSFSPGDYEASISFELTEPLPIQLVQNSETLINGDLDMFVEQGESGHFKAEFRTEEAFHGELCLNCVDWQGKAILESTPAQTAIEPGASKEVALPFSCPMDTELVYYEYDYYARPDGYNAFGLVDKNGFSRGVCVEQYTGIEDEQAETSCRLVPQHGSFLLQGAEAGSHVRVVTLGGSLVYEGTAQSTEMLIPMTGAAQGFYLIIVENKDGKKTALKGILK